MSKKCDRVLVVDLEATCWDGPVPRGEESEIIEIGVCPLEIGSGKRLERRSILVRPVRSRVSPFCTQLTTLTQSQVDAGVSFEVACEILRKEYLSKDRVWASFGDYDRNQVQSQCTATGVGYPFGSRHLNVKTLFALVHALPHELGMSEALRLLGHEMDGTHHRGHDDAWNIAGILAELLSRKKVAS